MPGTADLFSCGVMECKQLLLFRLSEIAVVSVRLHLCGSRAFATVRGWATGTAARAIRQSFVQDTFDGAGAATALHIAAEAAVDFVRAQRLRPRGRYNVATSWSLSTLHEQTIIEFKTIEYRTISLRGRLSSPRISDVTSVGHNLASVV